MLPVHLKGLVKKLEDILDNALREHPVPTPQRGLGLHDHGASGALKSAAEPDGVAREPGELHGGVKMVDGVFWRRGQETQVSYALLQSPKLPFFGQLHLAHLPMLLRLVSASPPATRALQPLRAGRVVKLGNRNDGAQVSVQHPLLEVHEDAGGEVEHNVLHVVLQILPRLAREGDQVLPRRDILHDLLVLRVEYEAPQHAGLAALPRLGDEVVIGRPYAPPMRSVADANDPEHPAVGRELPPAPTVLHARHKAEA